MVTVMGMWKRQKKEICVNKNRKLVSSIALNIISWFVGRIV